jgi:catechol 2,3-dioxygenase-like lactoylglutathione lyase family enzyme
MTKPMNPQMHIITLGVADFNRALNFYEQGLGWKKSTMSQEHIAFFQLNGIILSIYPKHLLAEDIGISDEGSGFGGVTLAYLAKSEAEVDTVIKQVENLGATILKQPQKAFWGGYSSYFKDLDGHIFEVAYNPYISFDDRDIPMV